MLDYTLPTVHRRRADDDPEADERDRPSHLVKEAPRVDSDHQPGSARRHQHDLPLKTDKIDSEGASIERVSKATVTFFHFESTSFHLK